MKDTNCAYCVEGELVEKFGIKLMDLDASKVYLFKEQSHPGRVIVASKFHVSEIVDLPRRDRQAFLDDVALVADALHNVFKPRKVNYGAYGDTGCHLHFHLVPKYENDPFEWGGVFAMNPQRTFLSETGYAEIAAKIKAALYLAKDSDLRRTLIELRRDVLADGKVDFGETTLLIHLLAPLEGSDHTVDLLLADLRDVRADGVITAEESERLVAALDRILA